MFTYITIRKVIERVAPNITSFGAKIIPAGTLVTFSDTITVGQETWGRIAHREHAYICISNPTIEYCARTQSPQEINFLDHLYQWAKDKGYDGPAPR